MTVKVLKSPFVIRPARERNVDRSIRHGAFPPLHHVRPRSRILSRDDSWKFHSRLLTSPTRPSLCVRKLLIFKRYTSRKSSSQADSARRRFQKEAGWTRAPEVKRLTGLCVKDKCDRCFDPYTLVSVALARLSASPASCSALYTCGITSFKTEFSFTCCNH